MSSAALGVVRISGGELSCAPKCSQPLGNNFRPATVQWLPAQPLLYAYCINAMLNAVGVPLSELFFSRNDAWFNLRLCLWWTIPTWTLGTYAVFHYGLYGFATFQAALQSTWLLAFLHAWKTAGLHVFAPLREPFLLSAGLVLVNLFLMHSIALSSIYRVGVILAVEAVVCGVFLARMLLSWRTAASSGLSPI